VKSSTATATTATADAAAPPRCRGRFAPSPNGLLHKGSLLAAVASWLDARARGGTWLIRIEDLDTPRVVPGAADAMLATLAAFGMESDEPVLFQSTRREAYREALSVLADAGLAFRCACSRGERAGPRCRCRDVPPPAGAGTAWRLRLDDGPIPFEDAIQGPQRLLPSRIGDPVLFRKDGIAAYQLAVVVDDAFQGITDVVRGADLLESTAWQVVIGRALGHPEPRWAHVPVLTEPGGAKLAKSRRSLPLASLDKAATLAEILGFLGISLPAELKAAPVSDMLHWSVQHWRPENIRGVREIALAD
jgi:glutamyl-Q tRNA(Asp) synthetase